MPKGKLVSGTKYKLLQDTKGSCVPAWGYLAAATIGAGTAIIIYSLIANEDQEFLGFNMPKGKLVSGKKFQAADGRDMVKIEVTEKGNGLCESEIVASVKVPPQDQIVKLKNINKCVKLKEGTVYTVHKEVKIKGI